MSIERDPIVPFAHLSDWEANLRRVARDGVALCEDLPRIAERFEAWWAHECLDRPIFIAHTQNPPGRAVTKRTDMLFEPARWFAEKKADLLSLRHVGDGLPNLRVDFGPVLLGGLLGGRVEFVPTTSWTHPLIDDDWSNAPGGIITDNQGLWDLLRALTEMVCADAAGRYLLCTPDLGGSADVLLNLRGSEALCMDVIERPRIIRQAIDAIYPAWHEAFAMLYDTATAHGVGLVHWLEVWSSRPYMIPACDFNYMISPSQFSEICLPDIARQTATVGRGVFHLDGPGATNHIDALLEVPHLDAIQFVPGSGTPSVLPWLNMFKKIQAKGRSMLIVCSARELEALCDAVKPEGLGVLMYDCPSDQLDALFARFCGRYA